MRRYITEFVGTFLFVFSIALGVAHAGELAPLVIGAALMCAVYMGGHISGGHYNPAVTLAVYLRGRIEGPEALLYAGFQLAGATLAALVATPLTQSLFVAAPASHAAMLPALVVEIVFTFGLCLVVLNVATDDEVRGNSHYGLAIGFTVAVAAFAGGPISGGAFNPAVGLGPALVALGRASIGHVWLYVVGPIFGAILAAATFRLQHPSRGSALS
jgi:aquaporin Z